MLNHHNVCTETLTQTASLCGCRVQTPECYEILKDNLTLMRGECFFVPGSKDRSWNQVAPATRILVRRDCIQQVRLLTPYHPFRSRVKGS